MMATTAKEPPRSVAQRIAQASPAWLGAVYAVANCAVMALHFAALRMGSRGLDELSGVLALTAIVGLYIVVTWVRDDDALPAGLLLVLIVLIGGVLSTALASALVEHTVMAAVAVLIFSPFRLIITAFLAIPVAALLVWIARAVSRALERLFGTQAARVA